MADETIIFKYEIQGETKYVNSLKEARKAQKELFSEALNGSDKAKKAYADLKDKLEDVTEEANTLKGSGVEKLTSSFALLSDGFNNLDGDKIKTAFKGIGSAMSAIPLLLLVEGVKLLIENFDVLIAAFDKSAKAIKANEQALTELSNAIDINKVKTDELLISKEQELLILKREKAGLSEISEALNEINNIKQDQVVGELKKADKAIQNILARLNQAKEDFENKSITSELLGLGTSEEDIKKIEDELNKALIARGNIYNKGIAQEIDFENKISDERKKAADEAKAERDKINKKILDSLDADDPELLIEQARFDAKQKLNDEYNIRVEQVRQKGIADLAAQVQSETQLKKKEADEAKRIEDEKANAITTIRQNEFNAAKGLSDLFFQIQVNGANGNVKKLNEIAKKKFIVDKAFNVAQATMEGVRSVTGTIAATSKYGPEISIPAGIAAGIVALANVAKIAAIKFEGVTGDTGGGSDVGGGGSISPPPAPPQFANQNQNQTIIQSGNNNGTVQAVLVETQSRRVQNRVNKIESQSSF